MNLNDVLVNQLDMTIPTKIEEIFEREDTNDNLNQYKSISNETCLFSVSPQSQMDNEYINIAPGEGRQSKSTLYDEFMKSLASPASFQPDN